MCGCGGDLGALRSIGTAGECPPPAPTHELPADELCAQCWAGTVTSMGPQCLLPPLLLCSVLVGGGVGQDTLRTAWDAGGGVGVWCWGCHGMRDAVVPTGMAMDVGCCGVQSCGVGLRYPILSIWCGVPGGGEGVCAAGGAVCPAVGCRACGAAGCSAPPLCAAQHPTPSAHHCHTCPPRGSQRGGCWGCSTVCPPPQPPPSLPPPAPLHGADCHAGINEAGGAGQGPLPWHCLTDAAQALGTGMGGPCEAEPPPQNGEQCPQRPHPSVPRGWMGASQSCGIVKGLCALPGGGAAWMCPPHWGVHSPPHERTLLVAPWGR